MKYLKKRVLDENVTSDVGNNDIEVGVDSFKELGEVIGIDVCIDEIRYLWIDLATGRVDYGPALSGDESNVTQNAKENNEVGNINQTIKAFDTLRSQVFIPDVDVYKAYIIACVNDEKLKLANSLATKMEMREI
ncbi:hypothetical protein AgCh_039934 [Apium graveolens]